MPSFLAVVLTLAPSKQADSNTTVVVSSMMPLYSPPITPATATGFSASAMTNISSESSLTSPSRVVIVSPALAFLMLIDASLTYLRSKACIGLPYSSIT